MEGMPSRSVTGPEYGPGGQARSLAKVTGVEPHMYVTMG